MARLKDFMDPQGQFYEHPPFIVQSIEPADDVANSILEHLKFGYHMTSITPVPVGPHAGRMLLLFHQGQGQPR